MNNIKLVEDIIMNWNTINALTALEKEIETIVANDEKIKEIATELEKENEALREENAKLKATQKEEPRRIIIKIFEIISRAQEAAREAQPFAISPLVKTKLKEIEYAAGDARSLLQRLD